MNILVPNSKFLDGKNHTFFAHSRLMPALIRIGLTPARFLFLPTILLFCYTADAFPSEDERNYSKHGNENKEERFGESPAFQAQINK